MGIKNYLSSKVATVTLPDPSKLPTDNAGLQALVHEGILHTFFVLLDCTAGVLVRKLTRADVPFLTISSRVGLSVHEAQDFRRPTGKTGVPNYAWGVLLTALFVQLFNKNHCSLALQADYARGVLGSRAASGKST
jgi:hypothetical protein